MTHPAMLPASATRQVLDYADRIGLARSPRMERVAARMNDPSALLPYSVVDGLLEELRRAGAGEDVGLRIGEGTSLERLGAFGERLSAAPTLAAGLELAVGQRHNSGQRFVLSRRGADAWLIRHVWSGVRQHRSEERDVALMATLRFLRLGAGAGWRPTELHLEGPPPAHAEELAALAGRAVHFGASQTAVVFPAALLAARPARAGPAASAPMPPPVAPPDFAGALRATVRALVQLGELSLAAAAEASGTSARSLQRRLARAGLRFGDLVDDVRFALACELLRDPRVKVVRVAGELGYTDSANFTRAFRRWAGVSPRAYQHGLAGYALAS